MAIDPKSLLVDYPQLEPLIDKVRFANARISQARLWDDGDGLALCVDFEFEGRFATFRLYRLEQISDLFKVAGISDLSRLHGSHVRVECVSQGMWLPFFRIQHIVDDEPTMTLKYDMDGLERFARGERV